MTNLKRMAILIFTLFLFSIVPIYSYDYLGEFSIGNNAPMYRVFKTVNTNDVYRVMRDEIRAALDQKLFIMEVIPNKEMPNLGADLRNLFTRSGGDILVTIAQLNPDTIGLYIYFIYQGKYYMNTAIFIRE